MSFENTTNHEHSQNTWHQFHLVNPSPLPFASAFSLFFLTLGLALGLHSYKFGFLVAILGGVGVIACMYSWWRDVISEGMSEKAHTDVVRKGLSIGMLLFIISEVMFFFAFFFSIFYATHNPLGTLDGSIWPSADAHWPPKSIHVFDPWDLPFMNTLILLLSGTSITWAHASLIENDQKGLEQGLLCTILLGMLFTCCQAFEYLHAPFKITEGVYPSNFFFATGFHGLHVIIGTIFLIICLIRTKRGHFTSPNGHLGFEFAAWYWHFVDVVWLFLFVFLYIWSSAGAPIATH